MVVDNLHIEGVALLPPETDSPLVVDPDTPLTFPIPGQLLELVAGRNSEVLESAGCIEKL